MTFSFLKFLRQLKPDKPGKWLPDPDAGNRIFHHLRSLLSRLFESDNVTLIFLASAKVIIHFLTNTAYGLNSEEFLQLAMADHLAWGYHEGPPFFPFIAALGRPVFGDTIFAIRLLPAVAGGGLVILTGLLVRELGYGGRFAEVLGGVSVIIAPVFLRTNTLFLPITLDQFFWCLATYLVVRIIKSPQPYYLWLILGAVCGIGFLNKYTMLLWAIGFTTGALMTRHRKWFFSSYWPYLGLACALVIVLPNLLWQAENAWPIVDQIIRTGEGTSSKALRWGFLLNQVLLLHPMTAPIWLAGFFYLILKKAAIPYRLFFWQYLILLLLMFFYGGRDYYLAPAYPLLFAAGAISIERWLRSRHLHWIKPLYLTLMLQGGLLVAPYGLPLLPASYLKLYAGFLAEYAYLDGPLRNGEGQLEELPPIFGEMFGWRQRAQAVAQVYHTLDEQEKESCVVLTDNMAMAGALRYYGRQMNFPPAQCREGSFAKWGPGDKPGDVVVTAGIPLDTLRAYYGFIRHQETVHVEYAPKALADTPIYLCKKPAITLQEFWTLSPPAIGGD